MPAWFSRPAPSMVSLKRRPKPMRRNRLSSPLDVEPLEQRALLAVFHVALTGDDATVNGSDPNTPFRTIQAAVIAAASASDGDDEIRVQGGTYDEDGVDTAIVVPNSANIQNLLIEGGYLAAFAAPDGSNPTIYRAQGGGDFLTIGDASSTVDGIAFNQNGVLSADNGIVITASNVTLRDVAVQDATFGVSASNVFSPTFDGVSSTNNTIGFFLQNISTSLDFIDSDASNNAGDGIVIEDVDVVSLMNTSASSNGAAGVTAANIDGAFDVQGGTFSDNIVGVFVINANSVSANGTTASMNTLDGLRALDIAGQVTITDGTYSDNQLFGIRINGSAVGGVEVSNVLVENNTSVGLAIGNVTGDVVINDGDYTSNGSGIAIDTAASATIDGANASGSTEGNGLFVTNVADVDVLGGTYMSNTASGVRVTNSGTVTLDTVVAGNNTNGLSADGVASLNDIDGTYLSNTSAGVWLTNLPGTATFDSTEAGSTTGGSGISADGVNTVELNGATLNSNSQAGIEAENVGTLTITDGTMSSNATGVDVSNSGDVSIDGSMIQSNTTGIQADTITSLDVTDATVTLNTAVGLNAANVTGAVTVEGGSFSNNFAGAFINGAGSLSLTNVTANNNTNLEGVRADGVTGLVDIDGGTFQQNQLFGVRIQGAGSVSVMNATMNENGSTGLVAANVTGAVNIVGGTYNQNAGGIAVDTAASATIEDVTANGNDTNSGVLLTNITGTATVTGGLFGGNAAYGVKIDQVGDAEIDGASLQSNALDGFRVEDASSATLTDLELLNNVSGNGGSLANTPNVTFNTTVVGDVIDEVVVRNDQIEHIRGGATQQPIVYSDVDVLGINTFGGDDDLTFDLDPLAGLPGTINVDMGPEPVADTLRLIGTNGLTINDDGFTILIGGGPTINYVEVENVDLGQTAAPLSRDSIGLFDPATGAWFLKNHNSAGFADTMFQFGTGVDLIPIAGDWDGSGEDSIGYYSPSTGTFTLRNTNSTGAPDIVFQFGGIGMKPIAGDWDGDGTDSIGVYDGSTFFLRNSNSAGGADLAIQYGAINGNFTPIVGDWDGNGSDTIGVYDGSTFFLRNTNTAGAADITVQYGELNGNFQVVAGDWDNDGVDTLGLYNGEAFFLRNVHLPGPADITFGYGAANQGYVAVAGDWDGLSDVSPLQLAGTPIENSSAAALTADALAPIVELAIAKWEAAGADASLIDQLRSVDVQISSLSGALLGLASSTVIQIDVNAAGLGWYVGADEAGLGADEVDLLTVVAHELGHVLGLADVPVDADSVMSDLLAPGVRREPTAADIDALFAANAWEDDDAFDLIG